MFLINKIQHVIKSLDVHHYPWRIRLVLVFPMDDPHSVVCSENHMFSIPNEASMAHYIYGGFLKYGLPPQIIYL